MVQITGILTQPIKIEYDTEVEKNADDSSKQTAIEMLNVKPEKWVETMAFVPGVMWSSNLNASEAESNDNVTQDEDVSTVAAETKSLVGDATIEESEAAEKSDTCDKNLSDSADHSAISEGEDKSTITDEPDSIAEADGEEKSDQTLKAKKPRRKNKNGKKKNARK